MKNLQLPGNIYFIRRVMMALIFGFMMSCHAGEQSKLNKLQGIYKYSFTNGLMNGTKYQSQNKLVLLKISQTAAYFNTHLEWANGHTCTLSGIAVLNNKGELSYSKPSIEGKTCHFTISPKKEELVFDDTGGACRLISCGARGRLAGVKFKYKTRANVAEPEIRRTHDYQRAMKEYNETSTQPKATSK